MGSSASKAASKAPQAAAATGRRVYPTTPSILNSATSTSNAPSYTKTSPAQTNKTANNPSSQYNELPPHTSDPPVPSQVHPNPQSAPPSSIKNPQIEIDGRDPQFSSALRRLGPAVPVDKTRAKGTSSSSSSSSSPSSFPTSSQPPVGEHGTNIFPSAASSSSNPSLRIVSARESISRTYEHEMSNLGRASFAGKTLLSARELAEVVRMRSAGRNAGDIEKQMRLRPGLVEKLGAGVVVRNVDL